jgi:hypothetical protein
MSEGLRMQPADVLDRLSIIMLHIIHGNEDVLPEYGALLGEVERLDPTLADFVRLLVANGNVWKLESAIRKGMDGELGLEEVGRRALKIREFNKFRVGLKDSLSKTLGGFRHVKTDHASA